MAETIEDPLARFVSAIKRGDVEEVTRLLGGDPALATTVIDSRPPLHLYADAPGHRPRAAAMVTALVAAGADLNAPVLGAGHQETALHWAASNDDVELIDALLDAGADIECAGSSIGGGSPIQSALGYAQYEAVRRLWERGARICLSHAAVLGLMDQVAELTGEQLAEPEGAEEIRGAFWNACRAGRIEAARYLLAHGADLNWPAPWDGATPLDAAIRQDRADMVAWLRERGAQSGGAL